MAIIMILSFLAAYSCQCVLRKFVREIQAQR